MTTSEQPSITCPRCGATSYHPGDIKNNYCGRCHWWTSDPTLGDIDPELAVKTIGYVASAPRGSAAHRARKTLAIRLMTREAIKDGQHVHLVNPDGDECYGADPPCEPRPHARGPNPARFIYDEAQNFPDPTET